MNVEKQNSLIREAHSNAVKHGFWEANPSNEHFLCLVLCELAEAVDLVRHIEHKMRYNQLREYKHGKAF